MFKFVYSFFENSDYDLFIVAMSLYKQVIALMKSIHSQFTELWWMNMISSLLIIRCFGSNLKKDHV